MSVVGGWLVLLTMAQAATPVVVLARSNRPGEAGVFRRISAELQGQGLEVVARDVRLPVVPSQLETMAHEEQAFAVVAIGDSAQSVEVWLQGPPTGPATTRAISEVDDAILATRTVEFLHAAYIERTMKPGPVAVPLQPASHDDLAFAARPVLVSLGLLSGTSWGTGARLGSLVTAQFSAQHLVVGARLLGPTFLGTVSGTAGRATLIEATPLGSAGVRFSPHQLMILQLSVLVGAHFVSGTGTAAGPNVASVSSAWTAAAGAGAELLWVVASRLALRVGLDVVVGVLPTRILLGDEVAASTPLPLVLGSLGVAFGL